MVLAFSYDISLLIFHRLHSIRKMLCGTDEFKPWDMWNSQKANSKHELAFLIHSKPVMAVEKYMFGEVPGAATRGVQ